MLLSKQENHNIQQLFRKNPVFEFPEFQYQTYILKRSWGNYNYRFQTVKSKKQRPLLLGYVPVRVLRGFKQEKTKIPLSCLSSHCEGLVQERASLLFPYLD